MKSLLQTKDSRLSPELKSGGQRLYVKKLEDDGSFEGYGSVFGERDSYREIVAEGAFKNSLAEHKAEGTMPALLWQHDPGRPIGVYTEMKEDEKGLFVRGRLALDTQMGKEAHILLKAGALNGLSIGFMPVESKFNEETRVRTLTEVELWEVSLVTFPSNGKARVENVKGDFGAMAKFADVERHLRDAYGVSQSEATAIVAKCKEIDRQHREGANVKSRLMASTERLAEILKN